MEVPTTLTPAMEELLKACHPGSLVPSFALRRGMAKTLVTDDPSSPSFLLVTIETLGLISKNGRDTMKPIFIAASDADAAARALPQGTVQLAGISGPVVEAILRRFPGATDPRPSGGFVLMYRTTADVPEPVALADGARVRRLRKEEAGKVFRAQPLGIGLSEESLARLIDHNCSYGVETASGELVSWLLRCPYISSMAMGCTVEEHRRKGYMRAIVREMVRDHQALGLDYAYCYVHTTGTGMQALCESEGFKRTDGLRYWMVLQPSTSA
eukprot:m51a1_g13176 hypothetical protein (270) ;mRNA; r:96653-97796